MIVVVGGQSRNCGKTTAVCQIIASAPQANWTAVKITAHPHGEDLRSPMLTEGGEPGTDTARYLVAGANRALWLRCGPADLREAIGRIEGEHLIIESNSILEVLSPDFFIFMVNLNSEEWKESARNYSGRADERISGELPERVLQQIQLKLGDVKPIR